MTRIAEILLTVPDQEMYGEVLQVVLEALKSRYGVFGYIDENGAIVRASMTRDVWDQCQVPYKDIACPPEQWGGIWGRALTEKKSFYSNEPGRVPEGHIPILNSLAVPILFHGETIGLLHVANKATDYDEGDQELLRTIAGHVAPILHARLQSDRQREELRQHSDHLEETVRKRTADLRSASKKLLKEVNERTRAEEALGESEEKYRRLVENLHEGIWATDKDARTTFVNSRMAAMIGYTCEEMLGRPIFAFMDEQGVEIARQGIERRRRGVAEQQDSVFLRKDGSRLCVTMAITPLVDANGQYAGGLAGMLDLTDRKAAEEALRESEELFRTLYESSRDGIAAADLDGYITECNRAYADMLGYSREELQRIRYQDITPSKWHALNADAVRQALERGYSEEFEKEYTEKDGTVVPVSLRIWRIEDEAGRPIGVWTIARDITERKQAEEALRESESRFRQVLEASSDAICRVSVPSGVCEYVSPAVLPLTGFTQEEFAALGVYGYRHRIHPDDWPQYRQRVEKLVAGFEDEAASHHEYRWLCKNGHYRWFADSVARVRDDGGQPLALVFTGRDTTQHREAEEALRQSEVHFRELSASSPVGVFRADAEGRTVYTNERLREITGLTEEQNMGLGWTAVVHPDDRESVLAERSKAIAAGQQYALEFRLQTRHQGISWVRVHSRPILSTDGRQIGRVGTIEDITEHQEAQERDRQLHEQGARTRELRAAVHALERMAATLGHELRNPLGVISNSAYFLCNQAGISDARALKHAEIIGREVKSARRVIDDILEFARAPQILLSPASLNVIVDQAFERSQIPANIRLTRRLAPDVPPLVCDAERLERAFLDVIANAVQAMPHGGRLSVRTQLAADGVIVVFSDTGEGIAPQNLAKVFDPMFTTKLRGIGLGLTVVRRTAEQHGGQVELKSKLGRGTSVMMTLPLAPVDSASGNSLPADAPCSAAQS